MRQPADEDVFPGSGHERVRPLEQADAAELRRRCSHRFEPVRVHLRRVASEQPAELAGVRRQHRRRRPLERLQPVEAVGVDHGRQVGLLEQPTDERPAIVAAAEPGADRERTVLLARLQGIRERALHRLQQLRLDSSEQTVT